MPRYLSYSYYLSPLPLGPPTVESVMSLLWGVRGRWKEIAEGLEFDEDLIDEIDTNNDVDEACLQVCVEIWVTKLQPSWEKLSHALKELGEVELAHQAWSEDGVPHHSGQGIIVVLKLFNHGYI